MKTNAETTTIVFRTYDFKELKTYLFSAIFIIGNIVVPQLVHLIPNGGHIFLPIYFFTLVGAYKYGWKVGLLTAIFSPLINSALFGMPASGALPAILSKSILLAIAAGLTSSHYKKVSLLLLAGVVASYQISGTLMEWVYLGDLTIAATDFKLGIPGILIQIFGGWALIKTITYKK